MGDTGSPYFLPYPELEDEADAPLFLQALASAEHNALLQQKPRSCRWKQTPQTLVTASTSYVLTWDIDDPNSPNDIPIPYDAPTGTWTIDRAGTYMINASVHCQFTGTSTLRMTLYHTPIGGAVITMAWPTVAASGNSNAIVSRALRLNVGDTIQMLLYSTVANTIAYGSATTRYSFIDISWIGG